MYKTVSGYVDIVRELIAFGCDLDGCQSRQLSIIPITLIKCQVRFIDRLMDG